MAAYPKLGDKPNIVIAKPPKYTRRKRKASAVPARIVVDHGKVADVSEDEHRRRVEATDRLWQEIKRSVAEKRRTP